MAPKDDGIRYEKLVEDALRGVVRAALVQVARDGLSGSHHFYITFRTDYPGAELPSYLREKYPTEMTIVLQYQFWDLIIEDELFSVTLSFNNVGEQIVVPFESITGFADPSVKFGLQFHVPDMDGEEIEEEDAPKTAKGGAKQEAAAKGGDNVVTLDKFRKK